MRRAALLGAAFTKQTKIQESEKRKKKNGKSLIETMMNRRRLANKKGRWNFRCLIFFVLTKQDEKIGKWKQTDGLCRC